MEVRDMLIEDLGDRPGTVASQVDDHLNCAALLLYDAKDGPTMEATGRAASAIGSAIHVLTHYKARLDALAHEEWETALTEAIAAGEFPIK